MYLKRKPKDLIMKVETLPSFLELWRSVYNTQTDSNTSGDYNQKVLVNYGHVRTEYGQSAEAQAIHIKSDQIPSNSYISGPQIQAIKSNCKSGYEVFGNEIYSTQYNRHQLVHQPKSGSINSEPSSEIDLCKIPERKKKNTLKPIEKQSLISQHDSKTDPAAEHLYYGHELPAVYQQFSGPGTKLYSVSPLPSNDNELNSKHYVIAVPFISMPYPPNQKKLQRSRNGCITCRRRKVKCDERRPGGCFNCERMKIQCEGYRPFIPRKRKKEKP